MCSSDLSTAWTTSPSPPPPRPKRRATAADPSAMYRPAFHREDDLDKQHALIRARPLGLLVSSGPGGLMASPAPFVLRAGASKSGVLALHLARANPQWRDLDKGGEPLAVFQDADAYVSPSWYATKRETGMVVPTWNYVAVHAYGPVEFFEDVDRLLDVVTRLTNLHEGPRPEPWAVTDAPESFIKAQLPGIVGLRMPITRDRKSTRLNSSH